MIATPLPRTPALWLTTLALLCACGEEPASPPPMDAGATDNGKLAIDIVGGDVAAADVVDATGADAGAGAADAADDGGAAQDTGWPEDLGSGLPFDVSTPDVTYEDLEVISTSPATGGTAPSFSITFSADVFDQSIADYTVQVVGPGLQPLSGLFKVEGPKLSWTPDKPINPASRVDVKVTIQVQDTKGQGLAQPYSFHFHTPGYEATAPYAALAARYAPDIRQGLGGTAPETDLLRALDFDGDWDATNNAVHTAKHPAKAEVAWGVAESQSHFFIHYVYTWARRPKGDVQSAYDNDTAGATVVVRRYPDEQPVALVTWFKKGSDERRWLWVTTDSGLVPKGRKPDQVNVRAVLSRDALFPKASDGLGCEGISGCTPRRFSAYLTGGSHQSCLWTDAGEKLPSVCATDAGAKSTMSLIRYLPGATATEAKAQGAKPGEPLPTATYTLRPLFDSWFPRRASPTLFAKPLTFTYKAPAGRPGGDKLPMGSQLLGGGSDFGRPPWAWRWKPANNGSYYDLPRGTVFFDPAHALWARIGGKNAGLPEFDASAKTGLSQAYCFAPFLFIDQRDQPACKDSLPAPKP